MFCVEDRYEDDISCSFYLSIILSNFRQVSLMLLTKYTQDMFCCCLQETEMKMRVQTLLEEFEQEKADLSLDGQANVKVLTEKLDKEREAMTAFKVRGTGDFVGVF